MMEHMTHRERIFAALRHQRPDRVPLDGWFRPEIERALETRLGPAWRDAPGLDWDGDGGCRIRYTAWERRTDRQARPGDWPGAGVPVVWHDERTYETPWGWKQRIGSDGKYNEWAGGPLDAVDPDSREAFDRLDTIVPEHAFEPLEDAAARVRQTIAANRVAMTELPLPFKIAWHLRGMENLLMDFLAHPDFAHALYDRLYAHCTEAAVRAAQAGTELIMIVGDIATQTNLLFSHALFEEYDKPRLKRLLETARAASPLDHLHFFYHSDGDLSAVLPDLIEDLGFDILNPIQPECMDPYAIKARYGDRITLHGTMSVVDLLPNGPLERIREVTRERIQRLGAEGGFVLSSANVIGFDTPVEHILTMYETARAYAGTQ